MEAFGAEILRIDGDYDASVHRCAEDAAAKGWFVVSDTSYDGYSALPRQMMAGYALMASEVLEDCGGGPPTHVFLPDRVGSSEARRGGEEGVRKGRIRGVPSHFK